jgi:hypothetical protein
MTKLKSFNLERGIAHLAPASFKNMSNEQKRIIERTISVSSADPVDYQLLRSGTPDQIREQFEIWKCSSGPCVFVQFIPDEMDEDRVSWVFGEYGPIDRVELVPKKNDQGRQIGRMAFVHYANFYKMDFAESIATLHPEPHDIVWKPSNKDKEYILKCRINMRPIKRVDYSISQLADMVETLNDRLTTEVRRIDQSNKMMMQQIARLAVSLSHIQDTVIDMAENK